MNNILSIGQCAADHTRLSQVISGHYEVNIHTSDSHDDAMIQIQNSSFDLVLINRILDATQSSGLDIIKDLKSANATKDVPVMLISNFDDAQAEAVAAGAEPGFGKAALNDDATLRRLDKYLVM